MSEFAKLPGHEPVPPCPFCEIATGRAKAEIVYRWRDAVAIRPLNPVVDGHLLVIPRVHVADALEDPAITGLLMHRAARLGGQYGMQQPGMGLNFITSVGAAATQTVFHLHIHIVPRFDGDGLPLPWTPQQAEAVPDVR